MDKDSPDGGLTRLIKGIAKKLPVVLKSQAIEAAEVAALFLDQSTRQNLNKSGTSTGRLARSWKARVLEEESGGFSAGAYSDLPYAAIHETGGTISGKKGALAVPLTKEARAAGSPRNMQGLVFIGGAVYGGGAPRLWRGVTQFVLPKSVYIPPTGYIFFAASRAAPHIEEIIGKGLVGVMASDRKMSF
tara:strand:+ start:9916 stop:10482 length:567 start_codon:yes stop_codon:yes gene_type:complete